MLLLRQFVTVLLLSLPATAWAEGKVALVIGNAAYENSSPLANPINDARAVAAKLESIGFEVALHEDLTGQAFRIALGEFSEKALNADLAIAFYAGHAIEMEGKNYLIPVDAQMRSQATAQFETITLDQLLSAVRSADQLGMVMLDACRNNPFATSMVRSNGTRGDSRGLAAVSVEGETGLVVSFAAEAGNTADDGDGMHSPYTAALLEVLDQPGLEVGRMFRTVRAKVKTATDGKQVPIEQMQLPDQDIYLVAGAVATQPDPGTGTGGGDLVVPQDDATTAYFSAVKAGTVEALADFIKRYPGSDRANDARALMAAIEDDALWEKTQSAASVSAYKRYLLVFPAGTYADEAARWLAAAKAGGSQQVVAPPRVDDPVLENPAGNEPVTLYTPPEKTDAVGGPVLRVSASGGGDYRSIADAIYAADPGTTIEIGPGIYNEALVVDKPLQFIGVGDVTQIVISTDAGDPFLWSAASGRIENLTVQQTGTGPYSAITFTGGAADVIGNDLTSQGYAAMTVQGGANPTVTSNTLHDGAASGFYIAGDGTTGSFTKNSVFGNAYSGFEISLNAAPAVLENIIRDNVQSGIFISEGASGVYANNQLNGHGLAAIFVNNGSRPEVKNNIITGNKTSGIVVADGGLGVYVGNLIVGNAEAGVQVLRGANPDMRDNTIKNGDQAGVVINEDGKGRFNGNTITGNGQAGVLTLNGGNAIFKNNTITFNAYAAIEVQSGGSGIFTGNDLSSNGRGGFEILDGAGSIVNQDNRE